MEASAQSEYNDIRQVIDLIRKRDIDITAEKLRKNASKKLAESKQKLTAIKFCEKDKVGDKVSNKVDDKVDDKVGDKVGDKDIIGAEEDDEDDEDDEEDEEDEDDE